MDSARNPHERTQPPVADGPYGEQFAPYLSQTFLKVTKAAGTVCPPDLKRGASPPQGSASSAAKLGMGGGAWWLWAPSSDPRPALCYEVALDVLVLVEP